MESITNGVPMLNWPQAADQSTNCRYVCTEWQVGMELENDFKRDEVEKLIRSKACNKNPPEPQEGSNTF